jgi:hypothetical protein
MCGVETFEEGLDLGAAEAGFVECAELADELGFGDVIAGPPPADHGAKALGRVGEVTLQLVEGGYGGGRGTGRRERGGGVAQRESAAGEQGSANKVSAIQCHRRMS